MSLTVDDENVASLPGGIPISLSKFLDYYQRKGFKRLCYFLILQLPDRLLHFLFRLNTTCFNWIRKKEHFKYGCLNPSVVLNQYEGIIAVFTNLSFTEGEITPVVKILRVNKFFFKNTRFEKGDKMVSVSLYESGNNNKQTSWRNFDPILINLFTDDKELIEFSRNRINDSNWKCLLMGLEQLEFSEKEGLYFLDLPKDLVSMAN